MKTELKNYNQKLKIFGRKKGRQFNNSSNAELLKKYSLNIPFDIIGKKIILDVGSGSGENTIFLSKEYPNYLIIASDIYLDGNINLCKQLYKNKIYNVKIFNHNVLILFDKFNSKNRIDEIWILFPDPWPKKKHFKRRLINSIFLEKLSFLLERNKKIYIVTDNVSYFIFILKNFYDSKFFKWINDLPSSWDYRLNVCNKTRYFEKALRNNKKSFILIFQKI